MFLIHYELMPIQIVYVYYMYVLPCSPMNCSTLNVFKLFYGMKLVML